MGDRVVPSFALGAAFCFALEKGRVYVPAVISEQFALRNFTMLQMFLAAASSSQLCLAALSAAHPQEFEAYRDKHVKKKQRGLWAVLVGSSMLGVGMAVAGTCPGTIFAQLGAGVESSRNVLLGGLLGSYAYSLTEPYTASLRAPSYKEEAVHKHAGMSFTRFSLLCGAAMGAMSYAMTLLPGDTYIPAGLFPATQGALALPAWPAWLAGALIGALQVPAYYLLAEPLGSSTSIVALLTPVTRLLPWAAPQQCEIATLASYQSKIAYGVGGVVGAAASSYLSGTMGTYPSGAGSVLGGALLLYGARLAGGCTSGRGISGFALGGVGSWVAVAGMFGAGIAYKLVAG